MKIDLGDLSYKILVLSAALIFIGILLGSFVIGFVYAAAFGAFLAVIGIIIFIISELKEKPVKENGENVRKEEGEVRE